MHAGKPQKQALAIAYAVKRKAQKKAMGGMIHEDPVDEAGQSPFSDDEAQDFLTNQDAPEDLPAYDLEEGNEDQDQARESILSSIMRKIRMRHMGR